MIRAIVTDIEGTTSSLSFVKDVLFPYARAHMATYVREHARRPAVSAELENVGKAVGHPLELEEAIAQLICWIDEDKKITPLKALQGMIWEHGYHSGQFKGHVYEDAARRLRLWKSQGIALYVFSSGSVYAQKLLFGHSVFGDLTPLFSGYFDTGIGSKRETAAYWHIAENINRPSKEILFLSDIVEELDAAKSAGMQTCCLVRDNSAIVTTTHPTAHDFDEVTLPE